MENETNSRTLALALGPSSPQPTLLPPLIIPFVCWIHALDERPLVLALVGVTLHCARCLALSRFFRRMADDALSAWAARPPANQVVVEAGSLRLEFGCTMMEPVPWQFMADYARSKADAVERGFTPVVANEWWWEGGPGGRVCYVGLRVVEAGGVAVPPGGVREG